MALTFLLGHETELQWFGGLPVIARCHDCGLHGKLLSPASGRTEGDIFTRHCAGKPFTYFEALFLFARKHQKARSVLLGPDLRLVRLSETLFGIQHFNSYLIRVSVDAYVVNARRVTAETIEVLNDFLPVSLVLRDGAPHTEAGRLLQFPFAVTYDGVITSPVPMNGSGAITEMAHENKTRSSDQVEGRQDAGSAQTEKANRGSGAPDA